MFDSVVICFGANTADAVGRISHARDWLASFGVLKGATEIYPSAPEYSTETEPYNNCIVLFETAKDYEFLQCAIKDYEKRIRPQAPEGLVAIDIDIVFWNGAVMRPADACARYFIKGVSLLKRLVDEREELRPDVEAIERGIVACGIDSVGQEHKDDIL